MGKSIKASRPVIAIAAVSCLSILASASWAATGCMGAKIQDYPAHEHAVMALESYGYPAAKGGVYASGWTMSANADADRRLQEHLDSRMKDKARPLGPGDIDELLMDMMRNALKVYEKANLRSGAETCGNGWADPVPGFAARASHYGAWPVAAVGVKVMNGGAVASPEITGAMTMMAAGMPDRWGAAEWTAPCLSGAKAVRLPMQAAFYAVHGADIDRLDASPSPGGPCPLPRPWIEGAAVELRTAPGWAAADDDDEDAPFPIPVPGIGETGHGLAVLSAIGRAVADDDDEDPPFPLPLPGVGKTGYGFAVLSAAGFRAVH